MVRINGTIIGIKLRYFTDFIFLFIYFLFTGQTAPRQPAVNPDEQMIVHKEEILDPEDNDENQQVVMAGI